MASLLARLGRVSYRQRRLVVAVWVLALLGVGFAAFTLSGPTTDSFSTPGTESQRAMDLLEERLPQTSAGNASATVVFTVPPGQSVSDASVRGEIEGALTAIEGQPNVASVTNPFASDGLSSDGRTAMASVAYTVPAKEVTGDDRDLLDRALEPLERDGIGTFVGGSAATSHGGAGGSTEAIGMLIAAVVLAITFRALIAAGLPLLMAVVGVLFGILGIQVATGFFDLSSTTSTLALMLGLAVGIDYALLIISRYRQELRALRNGEQAIGLAIGTAGSAVVFAGLTVAIALGALVVVGIPFLAAMGIAAAGTVMLSVAVAITLLPALLGFAGNRILGRSGAAEMETQAEARGPSFWDRWAGFTIRRRGLILVGGISLLALIALPATDLQLGLPNDGTAREGTAPRQAYDEVASAFGPGTNGPLLVAIDLQSVDDPTGAVARIESGLQDIAGIASVSIPSIIPDADLATITVIPETSPSDSATESLVHAIRHDASGWADETGAQVSVTGETAVAIDVSQKLGDALVPYLAVIVVLALVLLTMVFRSVLVPLKATLGFLLSVLAAFGGLVAVFQWGWLAAAIGLDSTGPILSFLPILLIGILFGLAMDYEMFLVTRMHEAFAHGAEPDEAIREGFRHGGKVVTAAAIIMISVFGGFVLASDPIIKSIGFALALGVFLDAFVVRMMIVPAVMSILGRKAWALPASLDKLIPNIDIEGARLTREPERTTQALPTPGLPGTVLGE